MILIDYSSIIHRKIHTAISSLGIKPKDGEYRTSDFIGLTKHYILEDLFDVSREFGSKFGELVICLDNPSDGYWRKDIYSGYKSSRKSGREKSEINFNEVFDELEPLIEQIQKNLPWKVVSVPKAEADDIILVLSREYNKFENILIYSPDKDMIQAQRNTENVFQYSALTKKWLVPENKHEHMDHWIMEHCVLGDSGDDVPKVVDRTEFSENFLKYLENQGHGDIKTPMDFKETKTISNVDKSNMLIDFQVFKTNRNGDPTGVPDIYKDIRFGPSTLAKAIAKYGTLDNWLDSHPLYRKNYERNFTLVMEEGIPSDIWNEIVVQYKIANTDYNDKIFEDYLSHNDLKSILMDLPSVFKIQRSLTAEDFGW